MLTLIIDFDFYCVQQNIIKKQHGAKKLENTCKS